MHADNFFVRSMSQTKQILIRNSGLSYDFIGLITPEVYGSKKGGIFSGRTAFTKNAIFFKYE